MALEFSQKWGMRRSLLDLEHARKPGERVASQTRRRDVKKTAYGGLNWPAENLLAQCLELAICRL